MLLLLPSIPEFSLHTFLAGWKCTFAWMLAVLMLEHWMYRLECLYVSGCLRVSLFGMCLMVQFLIRAWIRFQHHDCRNSWPYRRTRCNHHCQICVYVPVSECVYFLYTHRKPKAKTKICFSNEVKCIPLHEFTSTTHKIFKPIAQRDRAGSLFNDSKVHTEILHAVKFARHSYHILLSSTE